MFGPLAACSWNCLGQTLFCYNGDLLHLAIIERCVELVPEDLIAKCGAGPESI